MNTYKLTGKIALIVFLGSIFWAIFGSAGLFYFEYKSGKNYINTDLLELGQSQAPAVAEGVWTFDVKLVQTQVNGMTRLPFIAAAKVIMRGDEPILSGAAPKAKDFCREFPLLHHEKDAQHILGSLILCADYDSLRSQLWKTALKVLGIQIIIALFIATTILILFHLFAGRPIQKIAAAARQVTTANLGEPIRIKRHFFVESKDELDILQDAINQMQANFSEAIQDLQRSEERFRTLMEFSPMPVMINNQAGELLFLNQKFIDLFGYRPQQVTSVEEWWRLACPNRTYREQTQHLWQAVTLEAGLSEREIFPLERRVICQDGTERIIEFLHRPIGELGITLLNDLTERYRFEEERRKIEMQMQHSQKLESLGILAGGIAHDFNNLLMGMLGYADLAKISLSPEDPALSYVSSIKKSARRAADLTNQLLAYSGKGRFVITSLDLNTLVQEMCHLLKAAISKKITLSYHLASEPCFITADGTQIHQIFMNLITNAADSIGEEVGNITITTGHQWVDQGYIEESYIDDALPEGEYIFFEVIDSGCGMDAETLTKMFDPFFTTKFTGRGLGLAAVIGIVRGHKGLIRVYSEVEKGTRCKVLFPAVKASEEERHLFPSHAEAEREKNPSDKHNLAGQQVLIVDDDPVVRAVAKAMLQEIGLHTCEAGDGIDALEILEKNHERFALVLLDMTMPRMDGEETFREIRKQYPQMRVLLTSGYNEQEASSHFVGKGLAGFIHKPFAIGELQTKVQEVLKVMQS